VNGIYPTKSRKVINEYNIIFETTYRRHRRCPNIQMYYFQRRNRYMRRAIKRKLFALTHSTGNTYRIFIERKGGNS
jgi:hypothetical protein